MTLPSEKLAGSLDALRSLQAAGVVAIRSGDLTRADRERLVRHGFLRPVLKGWYQASSPGEEAGDSTPWYMAFWGFCAGYLHGRFGERWCLSPEQSLLLHAGNRAVPRQLLVRAPRGRNRVTPLPHGTSLLEVRAAMPAVQDVVTLDGMRAFGLAAALVACSPRFFRTNLVDVRTALALADAASLVRRLLAGGHATIAGRLAAALRSIGRDAVANEIVEAMRAAGFIVRERDPFEAPVPSLVPSGRAAPVVQRLRVMWSAMRGTVLDRFPAPPTRPMQAGDVDAALAAVDRVYATDAYHSLSIEGYRVSPSLIERVRAGAWNPAENAADRAHRDALAARGYWQAHQAVRGSIRRVAGGDHPGAVAEDDHRTWHRELFAPGVATGLLAPTDLAGYRTMPVYIRRSMHVPPAASAVRKAMPAFFELLRTEPAPAVQAVLGHFLFVYIHPYADGNGRLGRLLMNVMLLGGGYPWMVVPVERREAYMAALEEASVGGDIAPFTSLLSGLVASREPV